MKNLNNSGFFYIDSLIAIALSSLLIVIIASSWGVSLVQYKYIRIKDQCLQVVDAKANEIKADIANEKNPNINTWSQDGIEYHIVKKQENIQNIYIESYTIIAHYGDKEVMRLTVYADEK